MRALLQRVSRAEVREADDVLGSIGEGLVVLLGVGAHDAPPTADALARKVVDLRMFADEAGKTNRSLLEIDGEMLVVSQFTLYADTRRGRRPGFTPAAPPEVAEPIYERFCSAVESTGLKPWHIRERSAIAPRGLVDGKPRGVVSSTPSSAMAQTGPEG